LLAKAEASLRPFESGLGRPIRLDPSSEYQMEILLLPSISGS
jgi:hypothetical protein